MYSLPTIKFELSFLNRRTRRKTDRLIDKRNKLKTTFAESDIKRLAKSFIHHSKENTGNIYYNFYKKQGHKIHNDKEFIEKFYAQYQAVKLYDLVGGNKKIPPYDASIDNESFISYLVKILNKRSIRYKLIMGVPRSLGGLDGLVTYEDVIWGVKILFDDAEVVYTDCDLYAQQGEINPDFEGIRLFEVTPAYFRHNIKVKEIVIPQTSALNNRFSFTIKAEFQPDLDTISVHRKTHLTGMPRYQYKSETFPFENFFEKEKDILNVESLFVDPEIYTTDLEKDNNFLAKEEARITKSKLTALTKKVCSEAKSDLEDTYEVVSYDTLQVIQNGLDANNPDIIFEEKYKVRDLLDVIDKNTFVLKIGEFIDTQIEINDKDDRERQGDIVLPYSRSFLYEVEVTIPQGITIEGLEQLNRNSDNETGRFLSEASFTNSILKIRTEKIYKGNFYSKEQWAEFLKFIDEAVDFRSVKLILKR
jgi:hypothetical protein